MAKEGAAVKLSLALSGALPAAGYSSSPAKTADDGSRMVCDKEQMARIQATSQTQSSRVDVIWLNCPQLRRDQSQNLLLGSPSTGHPV
jgi:hypothetical protein